MIIDVLIIKELFDYSDDEIVENLMLDLRLQYALHTMSFVKDLGSKVAKIMKLNRRIWWMDILGFKYKNGYFECKLYDF